MNMEEKLQAVVAQAESDGALWHTIIHGDSTTSVPTENGNVPSAAKQMADVRAEVISNVTDYLGKCQTAKNETQQLKTETQEIKEQTASLKSETLTLRNEAQTFKDLSQTTFNSISSTTNASVSSVQSEGIKQIALVQSAVVEQVTEATNQANRAEQATSSKANLDFSNISPSQSGLLKLIRLLAPDWSRRQILALNTNVTITKPGWILMRNTVYNTLLNGYINGVNVFHQYGSYGNWEEWNSLSFFVDVGDVVNLSGGELSFTPCKGVN